jgi:hypothetical protein
MPSAAAEPVVSTDPFPRDTAPQRPTWPLRNLRFSLGGWT